MTTISPVASPLALTGGGRKPASQAALAEGRDATQPALRYCCSSLRRRS